jgi:hypothetical protein
MQLQTPTAKLVVRLPTSLSLHFTPCSKLCTLPRYNDSYADDKSKDARYCISVTGMTG